jgi:hypothetical protein
LVLTKEQILTLTCLREIGVKGVGPNKNIKEMQPFLTAFKHIWINYITILLLRVHKLIDVPFKKEPIGI